MNVLEKEDTTARTNYWPKGCLSALLMASYSSPTATNMSIEETDDFDQQKMERLAWNGRRRAKNDSISSVESCSSTDSQFADSPSSKSSSRKQTGRRRGRKPSKIDLEAKLERSRQSARECRARKKLRYKCLEETVAAKENDVSKLKEELSTVCIILWFISRATQSILLFLNEGIRWCFNVFGSSPLYFGIVLPRSAFHVSMWQQTSTPSPLAKRKKIHLNKMFLLALLKPLTERQRTLWEIGTLFFVSVPSLVQSHGPEHLPYRFDGIPQTGRKGSTMNVADSHDRKCCNPTPHRVTSAPFPLLTAWWDWKTHQVQIDHSKGYRLKFSRQNTKIPTQNPQENTSVGPEEIESMMRPNLYSFLNSLEWCLGWQIWMRILMLIRGCSQRAPPLWITNLAIRKL